MLYIRSSNLIQLVVESLYLFTNLSISPSPSPGSCFSTTFLPVSTLGWILLPCTCVYKHILCTRASAEEHFVSIHQLLWIMLLRKRECRCLWDNNFISFGYIPRSGIAGSYGSSVCNFLRNLHTVFHSGCTSLHSHQKSTRIFFSPHPHQHVLSLVFFIIDTLTGFEVILTVFLICIALMINDGAHFILLLATDRSSLEKVSIEDFCLF